VEKYKKKCRELEDFVVKMKIVSNTQEHPAQR